MNITNGSLFKLIKTMSAQEQKEFTEILTSSHAASVASQYEHLFNHLCGLTDYDEKEVKNFLSKVIPKNSFPVVKNHLREKLYNYLLSKEPESGRSQIHYLLLEVEMLYNRQLYPQAEAICCKVVELAERYEIHQFILEANSWRLLMLHLTTSKNYTHKQKTIAAQTQLTLQKIELSLALRHFSEEILATTFQNMDTRNNKLLQQLRQTLNHPLLKIKPNDPRLTPANRIMYEIAKMDIYRMLGEVELAWQAQQVTLKLLLSDWKFYSKTRRGDCLSIIVNHFGVVSLTKHFTAYAKHLIFVEKILKKEFKGNQYLFLSYTLNQFLYNTLTQKNRLSLDTFNRYEKYYLNNRHTIDHNFRANYSIVFSLAAYETAQYQKGMDALQFEINEYRKANVREDLLEDFQISFLIHYFLLLLSQKQNHKQINEFQQCLTPLYNSFRKKPKDEDYRFDMCLIQLFRKLKFETTPKEMLLHVSQAEKILNELFSQPSPAITIAAVTFDHKEFIARCKKYLAK